MTLWSVCPSPPQVDCYDHYTNGAHSIIGSFVTTLSQLEAGTYTSPVGIVCVFVCTYLCVKGVSSKCRYFFPDFQAEFACVNRKKSERKPGYKNSGVICIKRCEVYVISCL